MPDSFSLDGKWGIKGSGKKVSVPSNWFLEGFDVEELTYKKEFSLPEMEGKHKRLVFGGVDYYAEVWLNGVKLGEHEGYFTPFSYDIDGLLLDSNVLEVKVKAPKEKKPFFPWMKRQVKGVLQHWDCRPGGKDSQDKGSGGIWKSVSVESFGDYRIEKVKVTPDYDERTITIEPTIKAYEKEGKATLRFGAVGEEWEETLTLKKGINRPVFTKKVDVRDWWPWDRGEQNIYGVSLDILKGSESQDSWKGRFGMRKVEWKDGSLHVNNERYFLRGTNYCSSQWLSEMDRGKYAKDMALLKGMNANAIRVHAHVENDAFYDVCDEQGILVWQDFPLQWDHSSWPSMIKKTKGMMREMVDGLYNHPSIFLWCCHNEPVVNRYTLDPFLEKEAKKADRTRVVKKDSGMEEHVYVGWYGLPFVDDDYRKFEQIAKEKTLVSEFGAQALPNFDSMKKIFPKGLWPPDKGLWKYHDFQPKYDLSIPMGAGLDGAVMEMMARRIGGDDRAGSIEEMIEKSQSYQADLNKFAIEAFRRRKYDKMSGVFQFMFTDCWPSITWSVLDYWREPKKAYEAVKGAYSPVLVSIDGEGSIWVVNDLRDGFEGTLSYEVERDGAVVQSGKEKVTVKGDSSAIFKKLPSLEKGEYRITAKLRKRDEEYRNSFKFRA